MGDLNPAPLEHAKLAFLKTNVAKWTDLKALFAKAQDLHHRIDHVFANAGIGARADYLSETLDASGELLEPDTAVFDIMLRGMINTCYLGFYHMRHQEPAGGSVVVTASASSFQRFRATDYTTAKHGVLGFMRGMVPNLEASGGSIRINGVAPSWTATGIVPADLLDSIGIKSQSPDVVARSVAVLMADEKRQGQLIYSSLGRYSEIEESVLLPQVKVIVGEQSDNEVVSQMFEVMEKQGTAK